MSCQEQATGTSALCTVENLSAGDHLCAIYTTEQEQLQVLSGYVHAGLRDDQKLTYIADHDGVDRLRRHLAELDTDVEAYVSQGRLELFSSREAYTSDGVFDAERMLQLLRERSAEAYEAGYGALRVAIEMTAVIAGPDDGGELRDFENGLNSLVSRSNVLVLGQYDRSVFDPAVLLDVLRTHSPAIIGAEAFDNFYYLPPEQLNGPDPAEAELQNWIDNLRVRARAEADLRSEIRFADAVLKTSGAVIVVLNRDGRIVRINEACKQITGYSDTELHGTAMGRLLPNEERGDVSRVIAELVAGTYPRKHENHLITKAGERRFLAWTSTLTRDDQGRVETVISTGIDITERTVEEENRVRRLEAEIARMEEYAAAGTTEATGRAFSQQSPGEQYPAEFERLRERYEEILIAGLEASMYKTDNRISGRLQHLARALGHLDAGPKDVVDMHVKALRHISVGVSPTRARALNEEARLLALELMGYLVTVYRNQVPVATAPQSGPDREVRDE